MQTNQRRVPTTRFRYFCAKGSQNTVVFVASTNDINQLSGHIAITGNKWHFSTLNRNLCFSWKHTPWPDNNLSRNVTKCWVSATHNNCYWPVQYHWSLICISGYHSFWIYWRQNNNRHFSMRKNNHRYKDSKMSANPWREITKTIGMDLREGIKKWNNYRDKRPHKRL